RPNACDLNLQGWDFVVMPDNAAGRPDPFTGQIPFQTGGANVTSYPLAGLPGTAYSKTGPPAGTKDSLASTDTATSGFPGLYVPVPALNAGTDPNTGLGADRALNYYYVFGGGPSSGFTSGSGTGGTPGGGQTRQTTANDKNAPQLETYLDL